MGAFIYKPGTRRGAEAKAAREGGRAHLKPSQSPCTHFSICLESSSREEWEDKRFRQTILWMIGTMSYRERNGSLQDKQDNLSVYEGVKGTWLSVLASVPILWPPLRLHCRDGDPTPKHRQGRQINAGRSFARRRSAALRPGRWE